MKITFISDTHGAHRQLILPETDMLIHAGDISARGIVPEMTDFVDWFSGLDIKYKIFIAGNHDFIAERQPTIFRNILNDSFVYLENESVEIEGIKIWGSPITPFFFNWAFNRHRGTEIKKYWEEIPTDVDILVTHGPPLGYGDKTIRGEEVGCKDLLNKVSEIKPKYHVFGHIHEDYGIVKTANTVFINASVLNLKYQLVNPPIQIEYEGV